MTTSTVQALMGQVSPVVPCLRRGIGEKISIIGAGTVGAAILYTLVAQKLASELVLVDKDINLARDELHDIETASVFMDQPKLTFSSVYDSTRESKVVIITAGQTLPPNTIDINVLRKNVEIYKEIIPQILKYNSKCLLLIVTQPVDIMSYVAYKISGLQPFRVIGTGCSVLSAHFRAKIAEKIGVATNAVQGCVIGETGPQCVPVWTSVSVGGVRLRDINPKMGTENDPEDWDVLFQNILVSTQNIIKTKTFNTWGISAAVANIVSCIIQNAKECITVTTHIKGGMDPYGKEKDVFLSMPCIICGNGVSHIVRQRLVQEEKDSLQKSANKLNEIIWQLNL